MQHHPPAPTITRRKALQQIAATTASLAAISKTASAKQSASAAIRLEKQSTGAEIWQITTEKFDQSNIYCEVPYCSRDSRYFIYLRSNPKLPGKNKSEIMAVEIPTWKQHRLDTTKGGIGGTAISHDGVFYYLKWSADDALDLIRADIAAGIPQKIHRMEPDPKMCSLGTVSADGRFYAYGKRLSDQYDMFGIALVDLHKNAEQIIDRDPYILNPHPQFEPGQSKQLMIQHNRGGKYTPEGKLERLVGPEGATLYLLSVPDGKRTLLQVGKPLTTPATGHEAWIGKTNEILLTVAASGDYAPEKGNLLAVRAGSPPRVAGKGHPFNHVGISRCGRFYCVDAWQDPYKLVIGSTQTGMSAVLCESKTKPARSQSTHPHGYLTPDLKWVIFNSNRNGFPHVHAASVPDGFLDPLTKA